MKSKPYLMNRVNSLSIILRCFRENLSKQLEMANVKLKAESLNSNLLQEQCAELEKEKKFVIIELDAIRKDFSTRLNLLDSEINTVSFQT